MFLFSWKGLSFFICTRRRLGIALPRPSTVLIPQSVVVGVQHQNSESQNHNLASDHGRTFEASLGLEQRIILN